MDASRRIRRHLECRSGHRFAADVWDVVDLDEHPEFKTTHGELIAVACAICGTPTDLGTALLLVGLLPDLPLVAVDGWAADDRKGRERVAQVLGVPVAPPPNWVVTTTRDTFPVLLAATGSEELRHRVDAADGPEPFAVACRALGRALGALAVARATIFALTALGTDSTSAELNEAAARLRGVGSAAVVGYLRANDDELAAGDDDPRLFAERTRFVERLAVGMDPREAQGRLRTGLRTVVTEQIGPDFLALLDRLGEGTALERLHRLDRGIDLAQVLGDHNREAYLRAERVVLTTQGSSFWTAETTASAELDLRRAIELTADGGNPELNARCSANLAMTVAGRSTGDRSDNIEEAIGLLRRSLEFFTEESAPDAWAMNSTNLSVAYVRRRAGVRTENLRTAEELCYAALRVRSKERNPVDWAYTTVNLAYALIERSGLDDEDPLKLLDQALDLNERAAEAFLGAGYEHLAANALHDAAAAAKTYVRQSLAARARRDAAAIAAVPDVVKVLARTGLTDGTVPDRIVRIAELAKLNHRSLGFSAVPEWAAKLADPAPTDGDRKVLARGMRLSAQARSIRSATPGIAFAVSCTQWDELLALADSPIRQRIAILEEGLALLSVEDLPEEVLRLADRLGRIYSEQREWPAASVAYMKAMSALDWIHGELSTQTAQLAQLSEHYKLVELAAYALAMAGRAVEAVLLLENGRARGLGADLAAESADMSRLRRAAPALAAEVERIQRILADRTRSRGPERNDPEPSADDPGTPTPQLRHELRAVVERIHTIDGFADFMTGVSASEIAAVTRPDRPLVYLVASPAGSALLLVEPGDALRATVLPSEVTSTELLCCVNRYTDAGRRGVLNAHGADLDEDIVAAQRLLGATFGQNLVDALAARHATGVVIVPGGILATLPLTTAHVRGEHGAVPISEIFTVTVTPSAYVHQICLRRAERRSRAPRLVVCAGDPEANDPRRALPWSRSEVRAISRLYGSEHQISTGAEATQAFLRRYAGLASHLHLSLHAFSDMGNSMQSGVVMADGVMTAAEFRASTEFSAQVVVVSACESGRISIGDAPNEFRGLPVALIACGAACVVASLWPVNDLATSLLMVRFHEELVRLEDGSGSGAEIVAVALRAAQSWLRSATQADITRFTMRHGMFRGDHAGWAGDRGLAHFAEGKSDPRPFSAPRHWASFVAIG